MYSNTFDNDILGGQRVEGAHDLDSYSHLLYLRSLMHTPLVSKLDNVLLPLLLICDVYTNYKTPRGILDRIDCVSHAYIYSILLYILKYSPEGEGVFLSHITT